MAKLTKRHWLDLEAYRTVDPSTFELLFSSVKSRSLGKLELPESILQSFPSFDKVYWRPNRLKFLPTPAPRGATKGQSVSLLMHECVHQLFYRCYKAICSKDKTLCLLTEATASVIDIYFVILLATNLGWNAKKFFRQMIVPNVTPEELALVESQIDDARTQEGMLRVYNFYQAVFFEMYALLNEIFLDNRSYKTVKLKKLNSYLARTPGAWVCRKFDLMNNILYANAYGQVEFSNSKYSQLLKRSHSSSSPARAIKTLIKI